MLDMALSTVSSLDESFSNGISLVAEEPIPGAESQQDVPMAESVANVSTPAPEGSEVAGASGVEQDAIMKNESHDRVNAHEGSEAAAPKEAPEAASDPVEGEEESASDDDAVLEVHD